MTPQNLQERLQQIAPDTTVEITDLTGTQNHYEAFIVSKAFVGKSTLEKHRIVYDFLNDELKSGEVHALKLKTLSPEEYEKIS